MKCLLCLHYDIVNIKCEYWSKLLDKEEFRELDDSCAEFTPITAKNIIKLGNSDNLKITVDINI